MTSHPSTAAHAYTGRGWNVVPLKPGAKQPVGNDWQNRRYQPSEIDAAFPADANVGVLLGEPSGDLVDVDLDAMVAVRLAPHFLPKTGAVFGRPGKPESHWLYRAPGNSDAPDADRIRSVKFEDVPGGSGVIAEIRTDGRMTMVPPSVHPTGERLDWSEGGEPSDTDYDTLWKALSHLATACLIVSHWERLRSQHHDFVLALAGGFAKSGVDLDDAERILRAVLLDVGDHEVDSRLRNVRDTYRKYAAGEAVTGWTTVGEYLDPKRMLRIRNDWLRSKSKDFSFTDEGNAQRFILRFGDRVRFNHQLDRWLVWDGSRWAVDNAEAVVAMAREVGVALAELGEAADDKKTKSWSITSRNLSRIQAMTKLARTDDAVKVSFDALDANPWLLNVANGTLNLRTGALQPVDRDDLITKRTDVVYSRTATAPLWERYLETVFAGDQDLIAFVRRLCGYTLTGSTKEQLIVLAHGPSGTGKTTLIETLRGVSGGYAANVQPDTLMQQQSRGRANPELARLQGARFVSSSETEKNQRLAAALIKQMSGGGTITVSNLYAAPFEFSPVMKLWIDTNFKPNVPAEDEAFWDRLVLIPFHEKFRHEAGEVKDLKVILRSEYPGILRWMVDGCLEWQRDGLNRPQVVKDAVSEYREESDAVAQFIADECEPDPDAETPASVLYAAFVAWAKARNEYVLSMRKVKARLEALGYEQRHTVKGKMWRGLAVDAPAAPVGNFASVVGNPFAGPMS